MKKIGKKEKLIEDIFKWIVKDIKIDMAKEKLLKIMIESTIDYLLIEGYILKKVEEAKKN